MNPLQLGELLAGMEGHDREAFLLALADEVPDEGEAAWLRGAAATLRPYEEEANKAWWYKAPKPHDWWWLAGNYPTDNHVPATVWDRLRGDAVEPFNTYFTWEIAWIDLMRALMEGPTTVDASEK